MSKPQRGRVKASMFSALLLITSISCQSVAPPASDVETQEQVTPRVSLGPGDSIEIKFFRTPELNETQTVRPDGKIALLLIGEVKVEGRTPTELQDELIKQYSSQLKDPEITVIVRSLEGRRIYVGGEVKTPSVIPMPAQMTALEAIMQAGGFNRETAEVRNVVVIRQKGRQRSGYLLNLKDALEGKDFYPFYLESRDIVYVPRTTIVIVDQWIDQHINKILPQVGWFYVPVR